MDRYEGPARLEWWANRSTCLAEFNIQVALEPSAQSGWSAHVVVDPPFDDDQSEAFEFYLEASPFFTLRLPAESAIAAAVQRVPSGLRLVQDDGRVLDPGPVTFHINSQGRLEADLDRP